jgi:sucrose-6-phosphate hydrolase SacC (GH32 family)
MRKLFIASACVFGCLGSVTFGAEVTLKLKGRYLNFPVRFDDEEDEVHVEVLIDGKRERFFDLFLTDGDPDFWVFLDVNSFQGKTAVMRTDRENKANALKQIYQSDEREYLGNVYKERFRPQLHFSSMRGWHNDTNGLVFYDGEYHLFYQHNPYGWGWGNMHWGHAVSRDLVHWEQLPEALYPDETGVPYSGSAVIDYQNTSGFKTGDNDVIVAIYTTTRFLENRTVERQNIAYSNDKGRTWTKYKNNPIIGDRFDILKTYNDRDPNVFWHKGLKKWVMVLFERIGLSIFTSDDLKSWEYQSHTQTFWECPELFELPVDGNAQNTRWVMYAACGDYLIGDFDGKRFAKESGTFNYVRGAFFAAQTFENIPARAGRRIQIGWATIESPDMPFNQMMGFPTELSLRTTPNGIRMFNEPVREIAKLHTKTYQWKTLTVQEANARLKQIKVPLLHVKCEIENVNAIGFGIAFDDDLLDYQIRTNTFYYNQFDEEPDSEYEIASYETKYLPDLASNIMSLEFIVDRTSLEVFVDHGRFTLVLPRILDPKKKGVRFQAGDGFQDISVIKINSLAVHEMKSIWE